MPKCAEMWTLTDGAIEAGVSVLRDASVDAALAIEEIYADLRGLARTRMRRERPGHTLRPTALVNEVYMIVSKKYGDHFWLQDRAQILATFSAVMRHFLLDYYRAKTREKRGGAATRVDEDILNRLGIAADAEQLMVSELTESGLKALCTASSRQYQIVELRLSLNLTENEIAHLLNVHVNTVKNDWRDAKRFLKDYFHNQGLTGRTGEIEALLKCLQRLFE